MTERDASGDGFVHELLEALPAEARRAAQAVLQRWAGAKVYLRADRAAARRRAARAMLSHGMARADVQQALQLQFRIDKAKARRDVGRALQELTPADRLQPVSLAVADPQNAPAGHGPVEAEPTRTFAELLAVVRRTS